MAEIISGKELAQEMKQKMAEKIAIFGEKCGRVPQLTVVLVGENPASMSYVAGKAKACAEVGIKNATIRLTEKTTEQELLALISQLNEDNSVDGILVQLPLPQHINSDKIIAAIAREKDVDGFHPLNVAALWQNQPCTLPCTPKGILKLLKSKNIELAGKNAVVVGRSNIVGQPVSKLLLNENATVTICHSRTKNLKEICQQADILIVAVGKPHTITGDMVKNGATLIDVGVNRNAETGKLCGDCDFEACAEKAAFITPVPGGVGPMTIACLMENTLELFLKKLEVRS